MKKERVDLKHEEEHGKESFSHSQLLLLAFTLVNAYLSGQMYQQVRRENDATSLEQC